jgi:hypothetical protein
MIWTSKLSSRLIKLIETVRADTKIAHLKKIQYLKYMISFRKHKITPPA